MISETQLLRWQKKIKRYETVNPKFADEYCSLYLKESPEDEEILKIASSIAVTLRNYYQLERYTDKLLALGDSSERTWMWNAQAKCSISNTIGGRKALVDASPHITLLPNLARLATHSSMLNEHQLSKDYYLKILNLDEFNIEALSGLAAAEQYLGNLEEAERLLHKTIELGGDFSYLQLFLSRLKKQDKNSNSIDKIKQKIGDHTTEEEGYTRLAFALAKELEDIKEIEESFLWYGRANESMRQKSPYKPDGDLMMQEVMKAFHDYLPRGESLPKTPVFILGMPRTGSTLTERIISSHSEVTTMGESFTLIHALRHALGGGTINPRNIQSIIDNKTSFDSNDFKDFYAKSGIPQDCPEKFYIEKLPQNIFYTGAILKCFPNAKVIYTDRSPMDSIWSSYKMLFATGHNSYSYDLMDAAKHYIANKKFADYWSEKSPDQFYQMPYDKLVADSKSEIDKLLDFIGLTKESDCYAPEKNKLAVSTASSAQVRKPINKEGLRAWKKFETQLNPIKEFLLEQGVKTE